jgi:hypothetical protein
MAAADSLGNRTEQNRTSRKEGKKRKKKERETVKRKDNERERKKAVRGKNYAVLQYSRV